MRSEIYIDEKNLRKMINSHLSNLLGQEVQITIKLVKGYSGYPETKVKKLEMTYDVKKRINNIDIVLTFTLDESDIKNILLSIIPECEVKSINIESSCHDYYGAYEDFDGLTIELKENVLTLGKK